ncbi:MAG: MBL fold metallo-hydrolase [Lachnospiraceae bacterium]|nr:MBL fold metallo-hydrolase [Lachnospiraceae bacterium]
MSELKVGCLSLGMLGNNTYFVHKEGEYDCIVIDPARDGELLVTRLREKGLSIKAVFLTHAHFDHIGGVEGVVKLSEAKIYGGKEDSNAFLDPSINLSTEYLRKDISIKLDYELSEGDTVEIGSMKCKILTTPGHTPGSICFYFEEDKVLFSGDTLFLESVGRTDLLNGSSAELQKSVERLLKLPEDTKVYPGHEDFTTIGHEREYNPYSTGL